MLDKEDARVQLQAVQLLHQRVYVLVRVVHQLWDCPALEKEVREFCMGLYGELMTEIFPPTHKLLLNLQMEWEVMYNGNPDELEED